MSLTQAIDYNNPASFVASANMSITSKAQIALDTNPSQFFTQGFLSDTGFTYNSSLAEFLAGEVLQIDQTPANSSFGGQFSTLDLSWNKDGSVSGTSLGTPTIAGGKLSCPPSGNGRYFAYDTSPIETHKFKITSNYSGTPASNYNVISLDNGVDTNDRCYLMHSGTGSLRLYLKDNVGTTILPLTVFVGWIPVAATEYEFELVIDSVAGTIRLFIDGVLGGTLTPGAWSRGGISSNVYYGAWGPVYNTSDYLYDDVLYFTDAQHTASYTPGYTVPSNIYLESKVDLPQFSYPGVGAIQAYTSFSIIETDSPRFIINSEYWNGVAWVASAGTYATANSAADVLANIGSLAVVDTVDISVVFGDSNTQQSIENLIWTYSGQIYPITYQSAKFDTAITTDGIESMTESTAVIPAGDSITYTLEVNGVEKYYNAIDDEWQVSSGGSQSNDLSTFNSNISKLDLEAGGADVKLIMYMKSNDGSTTPELTSNTVTYSFFANPITCQTCTIYGYLWDNCQPEEGSAVRFKSSPSIQNKNANFFAIDETVLSRASGYFEVSLPREATFEYKMQITIDDTGSKKGTSGTITVPDQASVALDALI